MSKVPCGGFKLDENFLSMNENDELSLTGGSGEGKAYQYLVTDGDGNAKWEDRLAYEYTEWKDFVLNEQTLIDGFVMPPIGDTVTVKVNGVESVETVKLGEMGGLSYLYIGSTDLAGLTSGADGWFIGADTNTNNIFGLAKPATTVSLFLTKQHKIDEKYIQQDKDFVRPLSYYTGKDWSLFKLYYNESGEELIAYKCDSINQPSREKVCILDGANVGIGKFFSSVCEEAFFVVEYKILSDGMIRINNTIYGTDETKIAELAADEGFTLTTKPTT